MAMVELRKEDQVAVLTINNPPVNALNSRVMAELLQNLEELAGDDGVRVLIVTGAGDRAFVAGADIKEFPGLFKGQAGLAGQFALAGHKMFNALDNFPRPTIAAVNGLALGGGCELALACDLRVAADTAQFGLPEIKLGLFPGGGGTQRLPRLIGEARAKELMYLGDPISAGEALQIGLVNRVVPAGQLVEETMKLAGKLATRPGVALNLIKQAVDRGVQVSLEEGLKIEADLFDRVFLTEDVKEGVNAFIEKRKAEFKHR
ncbi:enoyl-CoA hydratase/isomerase family protein [Desulfallas sp. Bu1-1]|uniref:enoyl-CoA hydratase/isomerase family protein n=1 Tax=Desulfallas sp. Bu1-1 TaxID=2787620 RepID=UPI001A9AB207|nr:enoyl-CoA hydratase [Desulfallas sp. Bu1-1]